MKKHLLIGILLIILLCNSSVFAMGKIRDSLLGTFEARITRTDKLTLDTLTEMNLIISTVRPNMYTEVYVTEEEYKQLELLGYPIYKLPERLSKGPPPGYPTFAEMSAHLDSVANEHSDICRLWSAGTASDGNELWIMKISDNPDNEEDEPEFFYKSHMHGDEYVCMPMMTNLIDYLTDNYGTDTQVTRLVDSVEIWILPLMNPYGYINSSRGNAGGTDLNRNFPDRIDDPTNTPDGRAIETQIVWGIHNEHNFVLSANFHSGALVVNYPWDSNESGANVYTATNEDDLFIDISLAYSTLNLPMYNSVYYPQGITNGADWYVIYGGMQDWAYHWYACNEVTIELDVDKYTPWAEIPDFWDDNRESLLAYMECCLEGIRGVILDATTKAPLEAIITIEGIDDVERKTDPDVGDYYWMCLPGTYNMTINVDGYMPRTINNILVNDGSATRVDILMSHPQELVSSEAHIDTLNNSDEDMFYFHIPNDATEFIIEATSNGGNNLDIYITYNAFPNISHCDYTSSGTTINMNISEASSPPLAKGNYYILVEGTNNDEYTITATHNGNSGLLLYDDGSAESEQGVDVDNIIGVKFTPSVYPVSLNSYLFYIYNITDNPNIKVEVYDDDGSAGKPGTLLTGPISGTVTETGWLQINDPNKIIISEGSFYVCLKWLENNNPTLGMDENTPPDGKNYFRIGGLWYTFEEMGITNKSAMIRVIAPETTYTGEDPEPDMPEQYILEQNYPNPFNPNTSIKYSLTKPSKVNLQIYNLKGELIRTLVDENKTEGNYTITWNGTDDAGIKVSSGVYIYTLKSDYFTSSKKMILLK